MGLLWTIHDCHRWARSLYPEVRFWVANRLEEIFSREAGPIMASLLQDEVEGVAARAASYFVRWPDAKFADSLLRAFQTGKGPLLESCALALAKVGDDRFVPVFFKRYGSKSFSPLDHPGILHAMMELKEPEGIRLIHELLEKAEEIEKKDGKETEQNLEDLLSLCTWTLLHCHQPEEMAFLLKYFLASPRCEEWGYLILANFVSHAGAPYTREDLEEETRSRAFFRLSALEQDEIARLRTNGEEKSAKTIRNLLRRKNYIELIRTLHQGAEAIFEREKDIIGEPAMRKWEERETQPLVNLWLLRTLAGEVPLIEKTEPTVQRRLAITSLVIYTRLLDCQELIGRFPERMTGEVKMNLFLKDREDVPEDEEMIHLLSQGDPPTGLVQACLKKIEEDPHSPAAVRVVKLLGRLQASQAIPTLFSAFHHEDDDLCEAVEDALSQIGESVLPFLEPFLRDGKDDEVMAVLPLLGRLPYQGTVEMILSHFEQLYRVDRESLVYAVEELGSPRFIPLLRKYLREDEPEEEVFSLLCRIHDKDDPELPRIERTLARRMKKDEQRMARLQAGDETALIRETIPLPLCCLQCRRTYTYSVKEVFVDREDKEMQEVYIRDPIICKNCGAEGHYEITPEARLAITLNLMTMVGLADAGKADLNEGPVKTVTLMVDGRPMNPKQGIAYYQKQIAKHPRRSGLRVGYGNLLLFWKMEEEAKAEFERAVELDPFAVEALQSLAKMEIKCGRLEEGYALYRKCLELFERGHFYRMNEVKREQLREHLEETLWDLQKKLRIRSSSTQDLPATTQASIIRKEKTGRNDPCPCGSGKKYKRCCLGKEEVKLQSSVPETMVTEEEQKLTKRLVPFAASPRFRNEYTKALSLFFSKPIPDLADSPQEDTVFTQFIEWFIHDYRLTGGTTIIQEFARTQERSISPKEREILQEGIKPAISLYEVQESCPERAEIRLKDLFTEEDLLIRDVSGSRQLVKWDLIGTRVVRVGEDLRASGVISYFPPRERDSLVRFFTEKWEQYRHETGEERWRAFMKARGYLVYHYGFSRKEEGLPPLVTPEYYELVFCKAHYDVENFRGTIFRLKQEYDFHLDEEKEGEGEGAERTVRFTWLKRGKSRDIVPEGEKVRQGLIIQAAFLATPESRGTLSLGTLTLTERRLTLEAISRERLEAGKRRIEALLGRYIRFRVDTFESVKAALKKQEGHKEKETDTLVNIPREEQEAVMKSVLTRQFEQWIHAPLPALDGKTPLETVDLPGGKKRLEQILKEIENRGERKKREGGFYVDVNALRKKLGLPSL